MREEQKEMSAPESVSAIVADMATEIIRELENGVVPWVKPWDWSPYVIVAGANEIKDLGWPRNIAGPALPFGGMNAVILQVRAGVEGFRTNFWVTEERIKKLGVAPKPQSRPCKVVRVYPDQDAPLALGGCRRLYNLDQIADLGALGVNIKSSNVPLSAVKFSYTRSERVRDLLGVKIREGGERACYRPRDDVVEMPLPGQFIGKVKGGDAERRKREGYSAYWATMWHEIVHWTGHRTRLNRKSLYYDGRDEYAREELVAEFGAAFLCSFFGIRGQLQYASYIGHWLKHLKNDKGGEALTNAVRDGERACQWVLDEAGKEKKWREEQGIP